MGEPPGILMSTFTLLLLGGFHSFLRFGFWTNTHPAGAEFSLFFGFSFCINMLPNFIFLGFVIFSFGKICFQIYFRSIWRQMSALIQVIQLLIEQFPVNGTIIKPSDSKLHRNLAFGTFGMLEILTRAQIKLLDG